MDVDKKFEEFFSEEFIKENESKINEIVSYIKNCKDEVIIETQKRDILNDCVSRIKNKDYKINNEIIIENNKIIIPYNFKWFWDNIKDFIPNTIRNITMPYQDYMDISFFSRFPLLDKIIINNYYNFNEEELNYLYEKTNIKNIDLKTFYNRVIPNDTLITRDLKIYKDIILRKIDYIDKINSSNEIEIELNNFNANQLKMLLNEYKNVNTIIMNINKSRYELLMKDDEIELKVNDTNLNNIKTIMNGLNSIGINVNKLYYSIEENNKKIKYTEMDFSVLDEISEKIPVIIGYDKIFYTTDSYSTFKGLVESMKWYKQIIKAYDLSPLEKLTLAYDIMKTFPYNESNNDGLDSREVHRIIETGNIVCVGYTAMLEEMLENIDNNIKMGDFSVACFEKDEVTLRGYHSRSMVNIDDDKYNVHGLYALDATWDSIDEDGKEKYGDDYDALSLYKYFLVPFTEYSDFYPYDSVPKFFEGKLASLNEHLDKESITEEATKLDNITKESDEDNKNELDDLLNISFSIKKEDSIFDDYKLQGILDNEKDDSKKLRRFDSKRLSFNNFLRLIKNVRLAEGYKDEYLDKEVQKVARINSKYYYKNVDEELNLK